MIWICPVCRGTMRWNNERFVCPVCGYDDTPKLKPVINADLIRPKWLNKEIAADFHVVGQCSVCKERRRIDNFCSNCGANMNMKEES